MALDFDLPGSSRDWNWHTEMPRTDSRTVELPHCLIFKLLGILLKLGRTAVSRGGRNYRYFETLFRAAQFFAIAIHQFHNADSIRAYGGM